MGVNGESTPPPLIGKIGPYTVFMTPPSTPKPSSDSNSPPSPIKIVPPPVQPPPPQIHNPVIVSHGSSSVFGFFKNAVTKVQTAHSSLDDHLARWFGLNQSKYQWALDDYYETKGMQKLWWMVRGIHNITMPREGGLVFLKEISLNKQLLMGIGKSPHTLLAYINGDREFVLFDPYVKEGHELSVTKPDDLVALEEIGQFGYTSIYGELPKFDMKKDKPISILSAASERPWETIFRGESHMLPPLTKLCSEFLESLMEKRTVIVE